MKTSISVILATILLSACANSASEEKGTETTPPLTPSTETTTDTAHKIGDTMIQPNGVSNGIVVVDSTQK